jgi:hypothetical protein
LTNGHPPWRAGLFCTEAALHRAAHISRTCIGLHRGNRHRNRLSAPCPIYPRQRLGSRHPGLAASCQQASSCAQQAVRAMQASDGGGAITITRGGPRRRSWQSLAPNCLILRRRATRTDGRPLPSEAPTAAAHRWASAFARPANRLPAPDCALGRHFVRLRRRPRFDQVRGRVQSFHILREDHRLVVDEGARVE